MNMRIIQFCLLGTIVLIGLIPPAQGQTVTEEEAFTVAQNWVTLILQKESKWGESKMAEILDIHEFKRGEKIVGYFFPIRPKGFIVVSLRKETSPIQAYSVNDDLEPTSEEGLADVIKEGLEKSLTKIDNQIEFIPPPSDPGVWNTLGSNIQAFESGLKSGKIALSYVQGNYLLTSNWQQGYPYNALCPSGDDCSYTKVGCVGLAGAQIMRYWAWPYSDFNWTQMPDSLDKASWTQIDAVARLCADAGEQAGTDYGCSESTAWCGDNLGKDMLDAFEDHFQYSTDAYFDIRADNSDNSWYNIIIDNLNKNRPLQYARAKYSFPGISGHSMVLDGWKYIGNDFYGHLNDGNLAWVNMATIAGAEGMIKNIYPASSLGTWLSGDPPDDPVVYSVPLWLPSIHHYFDQDATGRNVTFEPGNRLQFLAGVRVRGTSPVGNCIRFVGTTSKSTRMYSIKGTATGGLDAGIQIYNGGLLLYNTGSIRFH
jgi:hypothetical protein